MKMGRFGVAAAFVTAIGLFMTGCAAPVDLPKIGTVSEALVFTKVEAKAYSGFSGHRIPALSAARAAEPKGEAEMPRSGGTNIYGTPVSEPLQQAYDAYLGGDGNGALTALDAERSSLAGDAVAAWNESQMRAQVLIAMGRASDAAEELERTAKLEQAAFGTNVSSLALRGEAKIWIGDYAGAEVDLGRVAMAIGAWRLPTSYGGPPTNLAPLVNLATAQIRAYAGLAVVNLMTHRFGIAKEWAARAEALSDDAFYVAYHPLYSTALSVFSDMYYGRAINLAVLGAATVATRGAGAEGLFERSHSFFNALGYRNGGVTIKALQAFAYNAAGRHDQALTVADNVLKLAVDRGLADMVWRVEVIRGRTLLSLDRPEEAEAAFRRAQAAVESATGSLTTDRSKRRFGAGKDDITYHLAGFDAQRGDWPALFRDLETGRGRAFVDLLANQTVSAGPDTAAYGEIKALDGRIRDVRLKLLAGGSTASGAIEGLLSERAGKVAALRKRNPELADVLSVSVQELGDIQKRLGAGDLMIYVLPAKEEDKQRLFAIRRDGVRLVTLDATRLDIEDAIAEFTDGVALGEPDTQFAAAETLAEFIGVGEWRVDGTVFVVPSGPFYFVPWGALEISAPVVQLPNGGWLARSAKAVRGDAKAGIVGDPDFHGELEQLPGARTEAASLSKLYGHPALTGGQATEGSVRSSVGSGVEVLHLATHGIFDAVRPLQSAVYLSGKSRAERLTAARLFENPIPAKLVVLSACETGAGKVDAGDDFLGLARSFYLSGTLAVVNSLWPIDDMGTRAFMEAFHPKAKQGDYAKAWKQARDHLKAAGYPPSVYGAFVLGGAARG